MGFDPTGYLEPDDYNPPRGRFFLAIAMYRRYGYADIERYNDNPYAGLWFEKRL